MGLNMVGAAVIIPDASDGTEPENPYGDGQKQKIITSFRLFLFQTQETQDQQTQHLQIKVEIYES